MKDPDGSPSSTRLMAWRFMWYFFIFNSLMTGATLGTAWILRNYTEALTIALQIVVMFTLVVDFLVLLAIFVPKQLGKIAEIKGLIELAKK